MERRPNEAPDTLAMRWLFRTYGHVFGPQHVPLAIGIHREIIANRKRPVSASVIRRVIYRRTNHDRYLIALAAIGAERHDLHGRSVAPVSPQDRVEALAKVRARRRRRQRPAPPVARVVVVERRRRFQAVA